MRFVDEEHFSNRVDTDLDDADSLGPLQGTPDETPVASDRRFSEAGNGPAASLEDEGWLAVDPRSVTINRIAGWIFGTIVLVVLGIIIAAILFSLPRWGIGTIVTLVGYGLFAVWMIWTVHVLPVWAYRHLRYRIGPLGFEIRSGIWWRKQVTVPVSRVQHTDVAQGPLERRFSLGKLVVYTAGTEHASVTLDGLEFHTAKELRDHLVTAGEAADGV